METLFGTYILDQLSNYYRFGMQLEIFLYTTSWEFLFVKIFMPYLSHEALMKYVCISYIVK